MTEERPRSLLGPGGWRLYGTLGLFAAVGAAAGVEASPKRAAVGAAAGAVVGLGGFVALTYVLTRYVGTP